jgi:putative membrane protein
MSVRWLLAALHLCALGIGLGAVWARGRALRGELDVRGMRRVFYADNWWGVAAALWLATGLLRAFGRFEKGSSYYLHNHLFITKMVLFFLILLLEVRPMTTLIGWRRALARGERVTPHSARGFAVISFVEAGLILLMVIAATGMARGYGAGAG